MTLRSGREPEPRTTTRGLWRVASALSEGCASEGSNTAGVFPRNAKRTRDRREIAIQIQTVTLKPKSQLRSMASLMDRVKKRVSPMKFDRHTLSKTFTYLYYVSPLASPPL